MKLLNIRGTAEPIFRFREMCIVWEESSVQDIKGPVSACEPDEPHPWAALEDYAVASLRRVW